jgi:lactoylglutathione lyase
MAKVIISGHKISPYFGYIYSPTTINMQKNVFISSLFTCFLFYSGLSQQTRAQLNHTAIYVMDVKTSAAFYQHIIGLDTIPEPFHDGNHAWFKTGPGTALHIIQGATEKKEYYKNQHTCFSVASVENFIALLKMYHISWEDRNGTKMGISTRVDGVKQIWLQDPDGYWIEINDAKD